MFDIIKKIIIGVLILGGGFILYSAFVKGPDETDLLQTTSATSGDVLGADIIKAINQINSLQLDRGVFDDPIFKTLVDRSEVLTPQPKGRTNPFASIGVNTSATSTRSATTTPNRVTR